MIDKGQWRENWPGHQGYTSTLYEKCPGIFNDHRESGPRFNVSSKGAFYSIMSLSLYWDVRTHTDCRVSTLCWPHKHLFQQQPSFPGGLPSRYWPGSTLLSFSGQPVLCCRVIWLWVKANCKIWKCILFYKIYLFYIYVFCQDALLILNDCHWRKRLFFVRWCSSSLYQTKH